MSWNKGASHEKKAMSEKLDEGFALSREIGIHLDGKNSLVVFFALAILLSYTIQASRDTLKGQEKMLDEYVKYVKSILRERRL